MDIVLPFEDFKNEVEKLYRTLPAYAAVIQNDVDIEAWLEEEKINLSQAMELRALNMNLYACAD